MDYGHKIWKYASCAFVMLLAVGCDMFGPDENPYESSLYSLTVDPVFPAGMEGHRKAGMEVVIGDIDKGHDITVMTSDNGTAEVRLPNGNYRITLNNRTEEYIFNGSADNVIINNGDKKQEIKVVSSKRGELIFKEIYCGGCLAYPLQGKYAKDLYVIVHNNSSVTQYLDNVCFGTADPYNAGATNVWKKEELEEFVPVIQAVWKIRGDGTTFPLEPGEDAVICIYGAIDHTKTYSQSVNLDRKEHFVCYDNVLFPNPDYHPAPGPNISEERRLEVVIKVGQANAYTFSINSPAAVLFRAPQETTIEDFVKAEGNIIQKPGSAVDRIVKIPAEWVLDGVEVFTGNTAGNIKRLGSAVDAGFIPFSAPYLRHTLHRHIDAGESAAKGYEVLMDNNNSSKDFYERDSQSLADNK